MKATKIDEIDLILQRNRQIQVWDFVNSCGLLRKHELYYFIPFSNLSPMFEGPAPGQFRKFKVFLPAHKILILYPQVSNSKSHLTLNYTMISLFCFLPASDGAYEVFQSNSRQLGLRWRKLWPETIRFKLSDNHIFLPYIHVISLEVAIEKCLGFDTVFFVMKCKVCVFWEGH